jgi:serine protease Do
MMARLLQTATLTLALLLATGLAPVPPAADGAPTPPPPPFTATTFVDLAKAQRPVVVGISTTPLHTETRDVRPPNHPAMPPPAPPPTSDDDPAPSGQSVGTGLIISADGLVLTNAHVIDRADRIMVTLSNDEQFQADVVGRDAKTDLALIRLKPGAGQPAAFPVARLGDSDTLQVGEWVAAIGNPFGLEQTLTIGILSGKGRALGNSPYEEYLQTDASINPGSSGGPLFNIAGEVIGLTTAINPSGQGIGFAIPINQIKQLLPQLLQGRVRRGWIGVMIQPHPGPDGGRHHDGVLITDVMAESPAAKAGLLKGDVVVEFDGVSITQLRDLPRRVATTEIGKKVTVKLLRKEQPLTVTVTIAELKD